MENTLENFIRIKRAFIMLKLDDCFTDEDEKVLHWVNSMIEKLQEEADYDN